MVSNFDFLKNTDNELFVLIEDAQKLFRDEYFNQCVIQIRIFAEKMAKKVYGAAIGDMTFDDILNCLKDKANSEREKEFVEDLFFIKKQGNKCAHGEDINVSDTLETIRRAFEASVNYAYAKKPNKKVDKLIFDETLLITQKPNNEKKLAQKYLERAKADETEHLFEDKQEESSSLKKETRKKDIKKQYTNKSKKKPLTPTQEKIKEKVKQAKKTLKSTVNKKEKQQKKPSKKKNTPLALFRFLFYSFCIFAIYFLSKIIFFAK